MNRVKVSVIIPVYNNDNFLEQCLDSVIEQTLDSFEIIIVNDCSTDNSSSLIKKYAAIDKRILSIDLATNMGASVARNAGIDQANGDYIIFIDGDDYWLDKQLLENLHKRAVRDNSDLVRFGYCRQTSNGDRINPISESNATINLVNSNEWGIKYSACFILISRTVIDSHHIRFKPGISIGQDALFCCTLYCHACILSITDYIGYCYRVNAQSASNAPWNKNKLFSAAQWFRLAIDAIKDSPAYTRHPDILQHVIAERLLMLGDKLAAMAFDILDNAEIPEYINIWAESFSYTDNAYLMKTLAGNPSSQYYQTVYDCAVNMNIPGLRDAVIAHSRSVNRKVTLEQSEARRVGELLLGIKEENISLEIGNGITITLSKNKAQRLAKLLISNDKPHITLNFVD